MYSFQQHSFLWADFYRVFKGDRTRLSQEFAAWMKQLGMDPYLWPNVGNPFGSHAASQKLGKSIYNASLFFKENPNRPPKQVIKLTKNNKACQIRKALLGIHLVYVQATQALEHESDPIFCISVYVKQGRGGKSFPNRNSIIKTTVGKLEAICFDDPMDWDKTVILKREFCIRLAKVLGKSVEDAEMNMRILFASISTYIGRVIAK